jgi:hypothetical protein
MIQIQGEVTKHEIVKVEKKSAILKIGLVIISLVLIMTLSITSNYLFFKELLVSSGIILFVTTMKFFEIKADLSIKKN